jgi:hypothetical protein
MQSANAIVGALRDAAQPLRGSNADYDALLEYNGESQSGKFPVDYKHDTEQQILERAEFMWKSPEQTSRLLKNSLFGKFFYLENSYA